MLEIFKKLTSGAKPATAAEFRAALAELDPAALLAAVAHAENELREAILSGAERAVEKAEAALAAARREHQRAAIARSELERLVSEADTRDASAALDAEVKAAEREAATVARDLSKDYTEASAKIVAVLDRLVDAERRVAKLNEKLNAAGRENERLKSVETRAFPAPEGIHAPLASVLRLTSLRPVPDCPGFGEAVETARLLSIL